MMSYRFPTAAILIAILLLNFETASAESREITWDDLVPAAAEYDDAFTKLTEDQLFELSMVAQTRFRIEDGEEVDEQTLEDYQQRVKDLQEQDVDIDGLIAMRDEVAEERIAKSYMANSELDGKPVRMPGYLLPLEFNGEKVSEFLLVPYTGACIHTPPPPPNQIVYVTSQAGFDTGGGLYMPVWVDGIMKTQQVESNLSLVDGSAPIPSSYTLEASSVKPYE
jgi:hypothetical protein